ncbi:MAG: ribonuclease HI [Bacteroidetes bacterium]|nr:ribonuclease HI [Bacteroidota bacterium]
MEKVIVYTDGACSGNPGPGGWGAIIYGDENVSLAGSAKRTTNNRMEMTAALEALRHFDEPTEVHIHTDSAYLSRAFTDRWINKWQRNGWKTSSKKPVENQDLWKALLKEVDRHDVHWVKVKGHADDERNIQADALAVSAMQAQL